MAEVFTLIAEVGAPIGGAIVMGFFIFLIMQQIMGGVVAQINTLKRLYHKSYNSHKKQ